jgi:hypothetical protein
MGIMKSMTTITFLVFLLLNVACNKKKLFVIPDRFVNTTIRINDDSTYTMTNSITRGWVGGVNIGDTLIMNVGVEMHFLDSFIVVEGDLLIRLRRYEDYRNQKKQQKEQLKGRRDLNE